MYRGENWAAKKGAWNLVHKIIRTPYFRQIFWWKIMHLIYWTLQYTLKIVTGMDSFLHECDNQFYWHKEHTVYTLEFFFMPILDNKGAFVPACQWIYLSAQYIVNLNQIGTLIISVDFNKDHKVKGQG